MYLEIIKNNWGEIIQIKVDKQLYNIDDTEFKTGSYTLICDGETERRADYYTLIEVKED